LFKLFIYSPIAVANSIVFILIILRRIDVDVDHERLAELHSKTIAESQGELINFNPNQQFETEINVNELFDDCINNTFSSNSNNNNHNNNSSVPAAACYDIHQAQLQFLQRWFNSSSQQNSKSHTNFSDNSSATAIKRKHSKIEAQPAQAVDDELEMIDETIEVQQVSLQIPLYDPLTHCRLIIPVRGSQCLHAACFDLRTHIEHHKHAIEFKCPICRKDAFVDELQVDKYLLYILQNIQTNYENERKLHSEEIFRPKIERSFSDSSETAQLIIYRDGSWKLNDKSQSNNSKRLKQTQLNGCTNKSSSHASKSSSHNSGSDVHRANSTGDTKPLALSDFQYPVVVIEGISYIDLTEDDGLDPDHGKWLNFITVKKEIHDKAEQKRIDKETAAERQRIAEEELRSIQNNVQAQQAIASFPINSSFRNNNVVSSNPLDMIQRHLSAQMIAGSVNSIHFDSSATNNANNNNFPGNPFQLYRNKSSNSKQPKSKASAKSRADHVNPALRAISNANNAICTSNLPVLTTSNSAVTDNVVVATIINSSNNGNNSNSAANSQPVRAIPPPIQQPNASNNNNNSNVPSISNPARHNSSSSSSSSSSNINQTARRSVAPCIDLNNCSVYELLQADVDYSVAEKIIAWRERKSKGVARRFSNLLELKKIKGVGEKNFRKLAPYVFI
jgi:DNA uptake protein ComE-like DNA-binding protein